VTAHSFQRDTIFIGDNRLNGTLPSEIGLLTRLQKLDLGFNEIRGDIPSEIGQLSDLLFVALSEFFRRL